VVHHRGRGSSEDWDQTPVLPSSFPTPGDLDVGVDLADLVVQEEEFPYHHSSYREKVHSRLVMGTGPGGSLGTVLVARQMECCSAVDHKDHTEHQARILV
jgi:hypothetical protein